MSALKKLAGQTAIYGLSSIIGRLLNYFLVPFYVIVFSDPADFGVITEMYAYVTFLIIVFTYGMETAYFKFSSLDADPKKVYSTSLLSLIGTSSLLVFILIIFSGPIGTLLKYPDHPEYIIWFALILALDAVTSIPFARLRHENRSKRFALIKLLNIIVNIGCNLFFLLVCPLLQKKGIHIFDIVYNPSIGVGYVFISNLIASVVTVLFLIPQITDVSYQFDKKLWRSMLVYALPLLVAGTAGMVNETVDRILLKFLYPDTSEAMRQVGIYGAVYKLSILMTLFIQTFRYAAEPFFFSHAKKDDSRQVYADVMKYFVLACSLIFLGILLNLDIIKQIFLPNKVYHSGLSIVPILLLANMCLGIFFNLSIWYKLTGQTKYGAYLAIYGAVITIVLNIWWIPLYGYTGCAWATLVCYASMMIISYFIGQKKFPVKYDLKRIVGYLGLALLLYGVSQCIQSFKFFSESILFVINNTFVLMYMALAFILEIKKSSSAVQ